MKKNELTFPVLVDEGNAYADKLNIVFTLPEKLQEIYTKLSIDLPRFNGKDSWDLPMSGRFFVASDGIIKDVNVSADHTTRPEPSDVLDFLK